MAGDDGKKNKDDKKKKEKREHNPRWKGYVLVIITSVVSFASIANVPKEEVQQREWGASVAFGVVTFTMSFLLLLVDRAGCTRAINFAKLADGNAEGGLLIFYVIWWIIGVGYTTRVGGIAYQALNIYFSSWFCLASCIYTLNKWSSAKDIISIHELTRLSATLKSWWVLFLASVVTFGASADAQASLDGDDKNDTSLGISFGIFSSIISCIAIIEHYNMCCFSFVKHGGFLELSVAILMILIWVVGVAVLTQDGGIAATITGTNANTVLFDSFPRGKNCTVSVIIQEGDGEEKTRTFQDCDFVPGSNLYFSSWTCLIASFAIAARWKAAQALQFAHAQDRNILSGAAMEGGETEENDDDDVGDIEAFVDAAEEAI